MRVQIWPSNSVAQSYEASANVIAFIDLMECFVSCACRLDVSQPIALGNIVCLNNFLGGLDEEWFRLVHVEIEARASPALASIWPGQVTSRA